MLLHNHTYKRIENNANRQLSNSGILADVFQMLLPLIFYVQSIPIVKHGRFVDVMDEHLIASNILLWVSFYCVQVSIRIVIDILIIVESSTKINLGNIISG